MNESGKQDAYLKTVLPDMESEKMETYKTAEAHALPWQKAEGKASAEQKRRKTL